MFKQLAGVVAMLVAAAAGGTTVVTPATFAEVLNHATAGQAIRLAPGSYDPIMIKDRHWLPPVTVDATAATLRGVQLRDIGGLNWHGGAFDGGDIERNGFNVYVGDHISLEGAKFGHFTRNGIGLSMVADAQVINNDFAESGSDGIDIASSRRIVVDHNRCHDFHPTPGAHPDCIQLWSRPQTAATADITITNNQAIGKMQGITGFNHIRDGIDDGGFDRVIIDHNFVKVAAWHGIFVSSCRNCVVRHNRAETLPDPQFPRLRTWIRGIGDETIVCDNFATDFPNDPGRSRCSE